ncbi:hypothetical protein DAPK24_027990 [Pichia kluyveri]|uniref:Transcription factor CBF/NF-Y/archaeal histone domain-containing protein n=1 Tax=Pichia kluyveri TaxID=36015 RepID=A0AAV5R3U1_PICKL|nr:hypothetical protein DAPK24_027990 [Pichia kluyveri]
MEESGKLPISRVKKIIKLDPEHISSTESANYVLSIATELFITQLIQDSQTVTKSNNRKKIVYNDVQKVVSSVDVYGFMRDIVPKRAAIGDLMNKGLIKLRAVDEERLRREMHENMNSNGIEEGEGEGDKVDELYTESI